MPPSCSDQEDQALQIIPRAAFRVKQESGSVFANIFIGNYVDLSLHDQDSSIK
jgi:hypothetical protein